MQKDVRSVTKRIDPGKQTEEDFFKKYKQKFFGAVKWNIVESVGYQLIFMFHQSGLFLYCERSLYGKVGALLSASYLGVTILVGGFDGGLLPYFDRFTSTKEAFKKFFFEQLVKHIFLMTTGIFLVSLIFFVGGLSFCSVSGSMLLLVGAFIAVEALKKILKQLLYLGFHNKQTALFEVVQMSAYVATVWICYGAGTPFSITLFLVPFVVYSAIFCIFCGLKLSSYYQTLPSFSSTFLEAPSSSFTLLRGTVLVNQLSRAFFSSNFLVPLFAIHGGFREAGVLTFANYLTHACTFFIQKITLPPAEALFSRIKKLSLVSHHRAFSLVLSLFSALTVLFGFLFFLQERSLAMSLRYGTLDHVTWKILIFFFFIHLLESMFMVYEKFFLLQEKIRFLALGNIITCALCYLLFLYQLPFFALVFSCIFVRFSFFLVLSFLIYRSKKASRALSGGIK